MNASPPSLSSPWRLSVAPMLDWTDSPCRVFHRLLTRQTRLYTEMVTTGALLHGDVPRHLDYDAVEHPVALQLGGSEPADLAACARLAEKWGYDEVNLNCGCPSERVQKGAFGACLMAEPKLVADGVKAMRDAVGIPVTVKHRIGIDREESYDFVRDFVGTIAEAGCEVFIVHARNAWLQGLSPKENREIPPLRYELVHQLKREFPQLTIVLNGGVKSDEEIEQQLQHVDGVMVGRQAYHEPWQMAGWDQRFFGQAGPAESREQVEAAWVEWLDHRSQATRRHWPQAMRHALGLWNSEAGARRWRQIWSDHKMKALPAREVAALADAARRGIAADAAEHQSSNRHPQPA
ncbi:tRNA dihydrouridine(20/20a) synthase DusA [Paucibacter sp. JuS9]|uniref:tRNA dihydrouridine(20/20a) synthase DusA n=1 Tax=Paucibacter sp. JuS9 TaxID=3228748 RepID=UPI00375797D1